MRWDFLGSYFPVLADAALTTMRLSIIAFLAGFALGFCVATGRMLGGRVLDSALRGAVDLLRGTPLLVQLLAWYLASSALGLPLSPFAAAAIGLSVNAGAFISEIVWGGLASIAKGQREAALSIGLSAAYSIFAIELPQAVPAIVPALIGFYIGLIKDTSLAYILGLYELTRTAKLIAEREFRPLEIYLVIAGIYFVMCFPLSRLVAVIDRRARGKGLAQARITI
jgi:polar amino acid transport system permease protein